MGVRRGRPAVPVVLNDEEREMLGSLFESSICHPSVSLLDLGDGGLHRSSGFARHDGRARHRVRERCSDS